MRWGKFLLCAVLLSTPVTLLAQTEDIDASSLNGLKALRADGVGSLMNGDGAGHTAKGVLKGTAFGIATFKATFKNEPAVWPYWGGSSWSTNAAGGLCVRGSGPVVLTTPDGSTIVMRQVGLSCHPAEIGNNLLDAGTYLIVDGTGRFSAATGTGNVVTGFKNGQASIHMDGDIVLDESNGEDAESDRVNAGIHLNGNIILGEDAKSNREDAESDRVNPKSEEENRP